MKDYQAYYRSRKKASINYGDRLVAMIKGV